MRPPRAPASAAGCPDGR